MRWMADNEEALNNIRKQFLSAVTDYANVFYKWPIGQLLKQRKWDHAIDLKPDFINKKGRVIPLSRDKSKELKEFITKNLVKWYLNQRTIKNNYLLSLISQLIDCLKSCDKFTKLDLWWGHNNIYIKGGNKWKAIFITGWEAYNC